MAKKNWLTQLQKNENAIVESFNPHEKVISFPSASVNFCFGNGHGLPQMFTLALGGPPKGGKSVLINAAIGRMHQTDPEGIAIKYDTEMRELGQMNPQQASIWGIDPNRYIAFSTNTPEGVFDHIEKDIAALCEEGMPLRLVAIDSITGIQGRRAMNADSISTQQIGDTALTLQEGFKRILKVQRKYKFAVILTCQIRAEMDSVEQMRGNKVKMALPFGVQHYAEYFMFVEPDRRKEAKADLTGKEFKNEELGDAMGNAEQTGHKIRVKMKDSSLGPKGRSGEFTFDYDRGIINQHEEAFLLGTNRGVIQVSGAYYTYGDNKWLGKKACLAALAESPELQQSIVDEVFRRDVPGSYTDEEPEPAPAEQES